MKAHNFCFYLWLVFTLISCGAKPSGVSLKVSGNMSITSAGYTGGVTVTGIGPNNKTFTANAATGSSVTVDLEDGIWTFYAAGWDGANPLSGDVYCGTLTQNLGPETAAISINIDKASCASSTFTNGVANLADANGFNTLQIFSCSSHYVAGSPITSSTNISSLSSSFCQSNTQPMDMKDRPGSLKIIIPGKGPTNQALSSIESTCFPMAGTNVDTLLKIPTGKIPVHFALFKDSNCQKQAVIHDFNSGIQAAAVANGIVLNPHNSTANALFLPYSIVKSALSPMMDKLPWISCNFGSFCSMFPPLMGFDYIISPGSNFHRGVVISRDPNLSCANFTFSAPVGIHNLACEDDDEDGVFLKFEEPSYQYCQSNSCSFDVSLNTNPAQTMVVKSEPNGSVQTFNDLARHLGGNPSLQVSNSLDAFERAPYSYGHLEDVRMDLGPDGVMGVFGATPCSALSGSKTISVLDEGQLKFVQVTAKDSTTAIPTAICDHTNPLATSCTSALQTFDKQIIFRMLENSAYVTRMNMHLKCSAKIGMVEASYFDDEPGKYRDEQSLIYWNTEDETAARYESYRKEVAYSDSARTIIAEMRNNFSHVKKTALNADFYIFSNNYELYKDGINIRESLFRRELGANSTTSPNNIGDSNLHIQLEKPSSSTASIFSTPAVQSRLEIPFLSSMLGSSTISSFYEIDHNMDVVVESPSSKGMVYTDNQDNINLRLYNGTSWTHHLIASGSSVPRLSKNANENYITYLTPGSNADINLRRFDSANSTLSSPITIATGVSPSSLAIGRGLSSSDVVVFWVGFDSIYFKQVDGNGNGDSGPGFISGTDMIIANSLKVTNLPGSSTKLLLVWTAINSLTSNDEVRSATYDTSITPQTSRYSTVSTLASQPQLTQPTMNFRLFSDGGFAYYTWDTTNGSFITTHTAKTKTTPDQELLVVPANITSASSYIFSSCADTTDFSTMGACTPGVFPGPLPFKPIKSGHDVRLRNMQPSLFNNLFTPISIFRNIN